RLRPLDRRQRFYIARDRGAIPGRQLRRVAHDRAHRTADGIAVGQIAGLEDARDIALRIIADAGRRDVGDPAAAALRIRAAGKSLACDDAAEHVARTVAFGAMARTVDEIGASVPLRRSARVRLERPAIEKQKFPTAQEPAYPKLRGEIVVARLA